MTNYLTLEFRKPYAALPLEHIESAVRNDLRPRTLPNVWQHIRLEPHGAPARSVEPYIGSASLAALFERKDRRGVCVDTIEAILIALADQGILADVCFHAGMPPVHCQRLTLKQVALLRKPKEVRAEVLAEHLIANVEAAFGSPLKFESSDDTAIGYFQDFDVVALSDSDVVRLLGPIVGSQGAEIVNVQAKATGDVLP